MMRYVTFGSAHRHEINGIVFDHNCVALVPGDRQTVFELFGQKFCFEYDEDEFIRCVNMRWFPRGVVELKGAVDASSQTT